LFGVLAQVIDGVDNGARKGREVAKTLLEMLRGKSFELRVRRVRGIDETFQKLAALDSTVSAGMPTLAGVHRRR
jgi:hypothetical protein